MICAVSTNPFAVRRNRAFPASVGVKGKLIVTSFPVLWRRDGQSVRLAQTQAPALPLTSPHRGASHTDAQLVARLAAGESDALALIYDRHAPALFRVLSAIVNSPADAEDALQETFVALALATAKAGVIRDLKSYLLVAARNQAISILRRRRREHGWEDVAELEIAAPETAESPHDFAALLAKLPLEQREIIALKVWEQMTFAEIAAIVGVSPNTAMSRYRYGIERLRLWCEAERRAEENRD